MSFKRIAILFISGVIFKGIMFGGGLEAEAQAPRFGPFVAIHIDASVIQGIKVDDAEKIWILLNPEYRNEALVLKISNEYKAAYRNWFNGEKTLVSPGGMNKAPNEWADWIETSANYIEYWMGDRLILHLKRVS